MRAVISVALVGLALHVGGPQSSRVSQMDAVYIIFSSDAENARLPCALYDGASTLADFP